MTSYNSNSYNTPMNEAINALAGLSRTCRRLNEIVKPFLYEEPFLLQGNCLNRDIQGVYSFIRILAEENGLADLVRVYRA